MMTKLHTGPRGGNYYLSKGKRIYVKKQTAATNIKPKNKTRTQLKLKVAKTKKKTIRATIAKASKQEMNRLVADLKKVEAALLDRENHLQILLSEYKHAEKEFKSYSVSMQNNPRSKAAHLRRFQGFLYHTMGTVFATVGKLHSERTVLLNKISKVSRFKK